LAFGNEQLIATKRFSRFAPAVPASVAPLRQAIVRFAMQLGAPAAVRERVALAVSEAIANAVLHAYVDDPAPGRVQLEAWEEDGSLVVTVRDEGRGLKPHPDSPGAGLGLRLIDKATERFEARTDGRVAGVELFMRFFLGRSSRRGSAGGIGGGLVA
jgi:anti-sigma regulatory factor (Ser/Thr protein kinase)